MQINTLAHWHLYTCSLAYSHNCSQTIAYLHNSILWLLHTCIAYLHTLLPLIFTCSHSSCVGAWIQPKRFNIGDEFIAPIGIHMYSRWLHLEHQLNWGIPLLLKSFSIKYLNLYSLTPVQPKNAKTCKFWWTNRQTNRPADWINDWLIGEKRL